VPTCSLHGPYSGKRCFACELSDDLERNRRLAEETELEAASRHWEAEAAADLRARQSEEQQRSLVRDSHKIQAKSLVKRAGQLLEAGLTEEAAETSRDALQKDRGYLPAYTLLGAAEYDRGNRSVAFEAMSKSVQLLGHGEWADAWSHTEVIYQMNGRSFPESVVNPLRAKINAFSGRPDFEFLYWLASRGWSAEVLTFLPKLSLGSADLVKISRLLIDSGDLAAGSELLYKAVVQLEQLGKKATPGIWLDVVAGTLRLEQRMGDSRLCPKLFAIPSRWSLQVVLTAMRELPTSPEWKAFSELEVNFTYGMLSPVIAYALKLIEQQDMETAKQRIVATRHPLSWMQPFKRNESARARVELSSARRQSRTNCLKLLEDAACARFLNIVGQWQPSPFAEQGIKRYTMAVKGAAHFHLGTLAEKDKNIEAALSEFRQAEACYALVGDSSGQSNALKKIIEDSYPVTGLAGDWTVPIETLRRKLEIDSLCENKVWLIWDLVELAWCQAPINNAHGSWTQSLELLNKAHHLAEQEGYKSWDAKCLFLIGWYLEPRVNPEGNWQDAIVSFFRAAEIGGSVTPDYYEAEALNALRWCYQPTNTPIGNWAVSEFWAERALGVRRLLGNKSSLAASLHSLGVCLSRGDRQAVTSRAEELFREAAKLFREVGDDRSAITDEDWAARRPDISPGS
jgi:tetratricopeptide (TPR) repeat protein